MIIAGKERRIEINGWVADEVLKETGINIFDTGDNPQQLAIKDDPVLASKVLFELCKDEGESLQEFMTNITGPQIFDGVDALWGALADFFPSPHKEAFQKAIEIDNVAKRGVQKLLAGNQLNQLAEDAMEKAIQDVLARFDELSTGSAGSQGSTPSGPPSGD